jgi:hypothetical protein
VLQFINKAMVEKVMIKGFFMTVSKIKKLPIGIPSFEEIVSNDYMYIDKTDLIHKLITTGKYYFLSRPRRFGKSLLCSTLEALFQGKRDLFKGLWIDQNGDWDWKDHPVIHISMVNISHDTPELLQNGLQEEISTIAKRYNIVFDGITTLSGKFSFLITELAKSGKVVLIIDEYDKPVLKHLDNVEVAEKMRNILGSFYGPIKALDPYLRFVLLTGITRFSRASIFAELNNLNDISMDDRYATMCGYTENELVQSFVHHIEEAVEVLSLPSKELIAEIRTYYDGYRFSRNGERVFNPFSVLLFFDKHAFDNYWFATGTPTFLIKLLKKQQYPLEVYSEMPATFEELGSFDVDFIPLTTILFQAGYLTIKRYDKETGYYILGFPNKEVESAFVNFIAKNIMQLAPSIFFDYARRIKAALEAHDVELFIQEFDGLLAHINYELHSEKNFHLIFYLITEVAGMKVATEFMTARGRIDVVLSTARYFYIFELKTDDSSAKAMEQIKKKNYHQIFVDKGKMVTLVGMSFDTKRRCVKDWVAEDL